MATNKEADIVFDAISILCLIMFSIDILLSVICRPGYLFSFFFWLDVISTISLILDIQLISNVLFYSTSTNASSIAKAGKTSRIGTKYKKKKNYFLNIKKLKGWKSSETRKADSYCKTLQSSIFRKK